MHPALSVIFFTTASGAGYGLLALLGGGHFFRIIPADTVPGLSSIALALVLITAGLLSSTFHLGHPERAWRALSQWRSSWLSREGVLALLAYIPVLALAGAWLSGRTDAVLLDVLAMATCLLCIATVYATAMIYASLRTIRAWANAWVPAGYIVLALMTGALLLNAVFTIAGRPVSTAPGTVLVLVMLGFLVKLGYWRFIARNPSTSTAASATGLGRGGRVDLLQPPHSQENYLLKEMGYRIARKHAGRLRRLILWTAFVLPSILTLLTLTKVYWLAAAAALLAVTSAAAGVLIERWLFFAEARHAVMLYYGRHNA